MEKYGEECRFVRLMPDGRPVVEIKGRERIIEIHGLEIPNPPPALYFEIFNHRLLRLRKPLRCMIQTESSSGQMSAKLFAYGWQDKSGEVWMDLALMLIDQGLARVAGGDFPERDEYLLHEYEAHRGEKRSA